MKFIKIFEEFVDVSDYKKWSKHANRRFYDSMGEIFKNFPDHDRKFNRIYFDLQVDTDNFKVVIPDEISDFMGWYGYPIIDYVKGICQDKDGRQIRIGKLLTKLGETELLKTYVDSKQNSLKNVDDLQVVISRHPYDVIGMSTNRGWTTCHDLNDKRYGGDHLYNVQYMLNEGCLVAYVIRKNDRNIRNPISRCLIKSVWGQKLVVDSHIYGTNIPEFYKFLVDWVKSVDYKDNVYK